MEAVKFNRDAGIILLVLGNGIFIFDEEEVILPMDKKLLLMSLTDLGR